MQAGFIMKRNLLNADSKNLFYKPIVIGGHDVNIKIQRGFRPEPFDGIQAKRHTGTK